MLNIFKVNLIFICHVKHIKAQTLIAIYNAYFQLSSALIVLNDVKNLNLPSDWDSLVSPYNVHLFKKNLDYLF